MKKNSIMTAIAVLLSSASFAVAPITGSSVVCTGNTTTLTDSTAGGTWSSSNSAVATISTGGIVSGISPGTATIFYIAVGDTATLSFTVNPVPAAISGSSTVCAGSAITLTDATTGGSWISGNTSLATVTSAGVVTGVAAGVLNIYYSMGSTISGCTVYHTVTVNAAASISGGSTICLGSSITLTGTPSGGTWSVGSGGIATVTSAGIVTGLTAGVTNIYYLDGGCYAYHPVSVNAAPAAISGSSTVCAGSAITLTDATTGGSWISGNTSLATVTSAGVVTGVAAGVLNIYYSMGSTISGCTVYHPVSVNAAPAAISGSSTVCVGSAITLTDATTGGSWISGNTSLATVTSAGVVTGVAAGVLNIYYSMGSTISGCTVYHPVSVNAAPAAISGSSTVCVGSAITLTDATTGGSWISGNTSLATVTSAGVVTGVAAGVLNIYYSMGSTISGCTVYHTVTVNATASISGGSTICLGSSITLTGTPSGGTWSVGSGGIATVTSAGIVTGLTAGVTNIYYLDGGCYAYHPVSVNAAPAAISGSSTVCVGSAITLTDATTGGSWISGNTSLATVTSAGVVTGVAAGVLNIYYSMGSTISGCTVYHTVTVNATASISGGSTICLGSSITLTGTPSGGTWSVGSGGIATVTSAGVVTGLTAGVTNIYYSDGGCYAYHPVTVNAAASISGGSTICLGSSITLTGTPSGGTWSVGSGGIATVTSVGVVTGLTAGVTNIYYLDGGCYAYHPVSVNAAPAAISGSSTVCAGSAITLTDATTGGSWISGNTSLATVTSAGVVTGVAAGVLNIYYSMGSTISGCTVYHTVTVNAAASISGGSTICLGSSITLTGTPSGGTWSVGSGGIATVTSAGVVTGLTAGVTNIYYSDGGCYAYHPVTVNAAASISGGSTICLGSSITLTGTPSGGTWSVGSGGIATVTSAGIVTGLTAGVTNIYYLDGGCYAYHPVSVNAAPAAISGSSTVCAGSAITLTDATTGGSWISGNTSLATVTSAGVVTGVAAGVLNIYYSMGSTISGCTVYHPVSVNAAPAAISGSSTVCAGSAITLTDATTGGSWISGNTSLATVTSAGVVTGVAAGVLNIYYSMGSTISGCTVYHTVTVNATASISGGSTICLGSSITLTGTPSGGTWSVGSGGIATVTSAGIVTGLTAGVTNIYYLDGGCYAYHPVSVNAAPAAISGSSTVCVGSAITLTDATTGGSWISGNTSLATVSSAGVVTGVAAGVLNIYYSMGSTISGCTVYHTVTVNATASISGGSTICLGSSITLTGTPSGGTWSVGGASIATVTSAGVVTGLTAGVTNIYYSDGGCYAYHPVTVNAAASISGGSTICLGSSITLTGTPSGGTWSVGSGGIATVTSAGVVTGLTAGVTNIYYLDGGCYAYHPVSVNAAPAAISGSSTVCAGSAITLTDATTGGSWISGNTSLATVTSAGVVTGVAAGVLNIYYSMGSTISGCTVYHPVSVNAAPAAISGSSTVCAGSAITLTDATTGGSWISGNTSLATVTSAGVVTGVAAGVLNIYYSMGSTISGCTVYHPVSVNAAPAAISGSSTVCVGSAITLTDATTGGSWISGNTSLATVTSAGVVTGVAAGVLNIYYSMGSTISGCTVYHTVTVNATASISGGSTICLGSSITLTGTPSGGTWSVGSGGIATVTSAGIVTGLTAGVTNIYYLDGGCYAYHPVSVNAAPAAISGSSTVCVGSAITLTDATTGGSWISGNTSLATVSSAGVVTGVAAGVLNIYYSMGSTISGCTVYHPVSVNAAPAAISGSSTVCAGSAITLTDATTGGSWISGNTSLATVTSAGVVTGVAAGVLNIYYSMGSTISGCTVYHPVSVNAAPAAISGSSTVCAGSAITLTDATTGGSWISGNTSLATVTSAGVVTGVAAGVLNIYYSMGSTISGCTVYHPVSVNAAPAAISGSSTVCAGSAITLTDATTGGSWISGNTSLATVTSAGVVTGVAAGVLNIYYSMGSTISGCTVYHTVTVNAAPAAISGDPTVCAGSTITLTDAASGGTWSVGGSSVATVTSIGVVAGVSAGVTNIYYHIGSCYTYHTVTVDALSPISGPSTVCIGSAITLTDATAGGTWVSGTGPVATISSAGVVTGVSAGVTNIYYVVGGCVADYPISVNAVPAAISGSSIVAVGSTIILADATTGGTWVSSSTAVATVSSIGLVTGVSAGVINIYYTVGGCGEYHTVTVIPTPGAGSIGGTVVTGAGKGTSGEVPVEGMLMHLEDAATGNVLSDTYTDAGGAYAFNGLADGDYIVYPELPGYTITSSAIITLGGSSESVTNVDFRQNTSDNTITPFTIPSGITPLFTTDGISVYPNPSKGSLKIEWTNQVTGMASTVITDMVGREVYRSSMNINASSGQIQIDLTGLKDGIYMLSITSGDIYYCNKLMIQR